MLKLAISPEVERFRLSFREWLSRNPAPQPSDNFDQWIAASRLWQAQLARERWVGVHWPEAYGGRSLSLVEEAVAQEELVRVRSPQLLGLFGLTMVGPVLIRHGSEAQRTRYLPKILSAEELWCQGFSEPGAGSDLAAIKTRAVPTEKGFVVSGQKVWTSFAQIAEWCFLLCRTSTETKKHDGLTYLLVDMHSPGITTRPLKQISGDQEFNEVFFDEVFVPAEGVVGRTGKGWQIAISTLMYERVVLTFARQLQSEVALRELLKEYGSSSAPAVREALGRQVARFAAVRALAYQHLLQYAAGNPPGPEGSLDKLMWSEAFQSLSKLAVELVGSQAARGETAHDVPAAATAMHRYLYSRGRTIAAGTSEIQRSIIAERVLGLPRLGFKQID